MNHHISYKLALIRQAELRREAAEHRRFATHAEPATGPSSVFVARRRAWARRLVRVRAAVRG